jgi:hypothetical protein
VHCFALFLYLRALLLVACVWQERLDCKGHNSSALSRLNGRIDMHYLREVTRDVFIISRPNISLQAAINPELNCQPEQHPQGKD